MTPHFTTSPCARAFTMIELMVVVLIIAILAALLLPVIGTVKAAGYSASCFSNLRQLGMGVLAYSSDYSVLPANTKELENAPGVFRIWAHTMAATYLDSQKAGSDGNAARDVLKCPGDRRPVSGADEAISNHHGNSDTLMQCVWINNGDGGYANYVRLWSSYASNPYVFTGSKAAVSAQVAMFWDSWTFTGQDNWSIPGTARHKTSTNMVFGDGHCAAINSTFMKRGKSWEISGWIGAGTFQWNTVLHVGPTYEAPYTNWNLPPWKDE